MSQYIRCRCEHCEKEVPKHSRPSGWIYLDGEIGISLEGAFKEDLRERSISNDTLDWCDRDCLINWLVAKSTEVGLIA